MPPPIQGRRGHEGLVPGLDASPGSLVRCELPGMAASATGGVPTHRRVVREGGRDKDQSKLMVSPNHGMDIRVVLPKNPPTARKRRRVSLAVFSDLAGEGRKPFLGKR